MPLHMEPLDISGQLQHATSVLIVACPVCPPVSLAVEKGSPLIQFFWKGIKTPAFEDYVNEIRDSLEQRGVRSGVFSIYAPLPAMCLWTGGQRRRLLRRAREFEVVVVLGCDSSTYSVRQALEGTPCRVIQAMRVTGITNAAVHFRFPLTLTLEEKGRVNVGDETGHHSKDVSN